MNTPADRWMVGSSLSMTCHRKHRRSFSAGGLSPGTIGIDQTSRSEFAGAARSCSPPEAIGPAPEPARTVRWSCPYNSKAPDNVDDSGAFQSTNVINQNRVGSSISMNSQLGNILRIPLFDLRQCRPISHGDLDLRHLASHERLSASDVLQKRRNRIAYSL